MYFLLPTLDFLFLSFVAGGNTSFRTPASDAHIRQSRDYRRMNMNISEMITGGKTEVLWEKFVPMQLCPS
jgi:hypothetical protein